MLYAHGMEEKEGNIIHNDGRTLYNCGGGL